MKGIAEEMLWFSVMSILVLMLTIVFLHYQGTRGIEIRKRIGERVVSEEVAGIVFSLFNNKVPRGEKSYVQCAIDAILLGTSLEEEKDRVFYGVGIGTVNLTEIIPTFIKGYTNQKWRVEVITPDGKIIYGCLLYTSPSPRDRG